jgi:hypothetical protein
MSNYFKSIDISNLCIFNGNINQNKNTLTLSVNNNNIFKISSNNVTINNNRVLTTLDKFSGLQKVTFGSGIFLDSDINYLRYCGNSDSGYDKDLRVANIYNNAYPIKIKKISIQKGYNGTNTITIPTLKYTKKMTGNFYSEVVDIDVGINSHIYVSVEGRPMEIFVDLYFEISENNADTITAEIINMKTNPTHFELFGYSEEIIIANYPIAV